ncbi:MAG: thiamine pyrophosphate-binding protein [Thermodesulfobacteriota bacterium]|jgi:acetolactate synthase-1/2/3 large subunit
MATTEKLLQEEVSAPEAIMRVLEEMGIDMVFGIAGGNTGRFFHALYFHQSTIRTVLVRHESLASVMAEVYGRLTGKPGVAIGQGAFMISNGLLGVVEAHLGCSPMLILTDLSDQSPFSQHAPYQSGTGEYGAWDAKQSFSGVTKLTMVPQEPVQAVQSVQLAIKHALSGEKGPVAVICHSAAFRGRVGPNSMPALYPTRFYLPPKPAGDPALIEAAVKSLLKAKNPVILAGNGVRLSQAYKELKALSEILGAPVGTTAAGKGVFPETHELALGVFGNYGQATANAFIGQADWVFCIGTRLGPVDTAWENPKLIDPQRQDLIQVDIEPKNAGWSFPCEHRIIGDAALVMSQLTAAIQKNGRPSAEILSHRKEVLKKLKEEHHFFNVPAYGSEERPILPERLIAEIHKAVADDAFIACDAGENRLFMTHLFQTKGAGTLIMPGIGAMGYSIPAAMAAKLIYPDRQVLAVCGDGGFGMTMNGLITAFEQNIPIGVVIFNNSALGWVKHGQGKRVIASDFQNMNYAEIAKAMGCQGIRVEEPGQISAALAEALKGERPTVVDVVTSFKTSFLDVTSPLAGP